MSRISLGYPTMSRISLGYPTMSRISLLLQKSKAKLRMSVNNNDILRV